MLTILAALVQLSLIIFVHELGHYFFAKLAGVRIISFNIGFGPKLWAFQGKTTTYALRWIPLGGYVQFADNQSAADIPPGERYENKSWLARFGIMSGGVLFNILFAWAVFYGIYIAFLHWAFLPAIYKSLLTLLQLLQALARELIGMFRHGNFAGLSGPIGVLRLSAQSVQRGWAVFCLNAAFLSANLGLINLLPFPALDGGRIIFLFYELIFRRKPNPQMENLFHLLGFFVLLIIIIVISFLDLLNS